MNLKRNFETIRDRYQALTPGRRAAIIVLSVIVLLSFFMLLTIEAGHEHDGDYAVSEDGRIWTCSMHPQIRQPNPGSCPICGMALIPAATDEPGRDEGEVRLVVSERAAALMDVRVWPAERRDLERDIRLFGRIGFDETRITDVTLRVDGQIEELHIAFENAPIQAGAPVAEVYSPAVEAAGREYLEALRIGDARLSDAARAQLTTLGLGDAQIDQIRDSEVAPRTFTVYSPASGIVSEIEARRGDWVSGGGRILRVAGIGQVWVELEAYESDVAALRTGQRVFFEAEAVPAQTYEGSIAFIDPALAAERRTVRVRVNAANPDGRLRPGMFVRARVAGDGGTGLSHVVIPASAPLITGRRAVVYVRVPGTDRPTFEPRDVQLGNRSRDQVEVLEGLSEGELVVVNGAFRIDSELQIRGRPSMMSPEIRGEQTQLPEARRQALSLEGSLQNVDPAFVEYRSFADALANDDEASARAAAGALRSAVDQIRTDDTASQSWAPLQSSLRDRLDRARSGGTISAMRAELEGITEVLRVLAAHPNTDRTVTLHLAHCPMVGDDAGAEWLTLEPEIRNPYFGEEMPTCGEITETL